MIDKATVQRIKDTANIVEVVSDYVHLTRRGANYMGLCPFHNERTPSFSVNPRRNICHCFSCGKGGSPVNFIMEKESISYYDALKQLAKKYGIKVEERELTPEERQLATEREGLLIAAEAAMKQMEEDLVATEEGRAVGLSYLYGRGVTDEAIKAFHLGYAIDKGAHLTSLLRRRGFDIDTLKKLGITGVSQGGNNYDKYRGRVIFPIMNSSGKTVGFGGRDLKGGPAKYINSPESVLYHKNNELYGICQAKSEIVRQGRCFLVEGYLDVISMWQSGLKNVVASSGTALTDGQIAIIHRFAPNITLLYDGDAAGIKAALRGIDMLLSHKMKVSVLLLPDGHDPDSFARSHTPEEFRQYVEEHSCDIIRFKMDVLMKGVGDDPQKKAEVIRSVVDSIACIADGVERTVYIGECARVMKIDEGAVASAVERARLRIVEQQQQERRRRVSLKGFDGDDTEPDGVTEGNASSESSISHSSPEVPLPQALTSGAEPDMVKSLRRASIRKDNPMATLERRMIELVVKFGYLRYSIPKEDVDGGDAAADVAPQSDVASGPEEEEYYSIADFVSDELNADNVSFSVEAYSKVFDTLLGSIDDFLEDYAKEMARIDAELKAEMEKGRENIAMKVATVADIEREERKLTERLEEKRRTLLANYARFYPSDMLASHEDSDIRRVATEVVSERYVLSGIFTRTGATTTDEDETQAVVRALTEWKSGVLNAMLGKAMEDLRLLSEAIDSGDFSGIASEDGTPVDMTNAMQLLTDYQRRINNMMAIRSQAARNIGDRIICAHR